MTPPKLTELYTHMEWADARMWSVINASEEAQEDQALAETLLHIHSTQRAFLRAWKGLPWERTSMEDFDSLRHLMRWSRDNHVELAEYVQALDPAAMDEPMILPWAGYFSKAMGRDPEPTSMRETVYQVASHTMHHRGQVATRVRQLGLNPPMTDFIIWAWEGKPAPAWPDAA